MLKLLKSGFYTTVQDGGRLPWRPNGVPVSGTMDDLARKRINKILENPIDCSLLEITMTGPTLLFQRETFICLGGAVMSATLNNKPIGNYTVQKIKEGDILSYGRLENGFRAYLGIKGGFQGQKVLGSVSQYAPLTTKSSLGDGDLLPYPITRAFEPKLSDLKVVDYLHTKTLEVFQGPEYDMLTTEQLEALFNNTHLIAKENDRMAYQLEETIPGHDCTVLTSATLPGTVQLTPAGKLIILMKDGQTTGGYPRILQLSTLAIATLSQKKAGDSIQFLRASKSPIAI
ncbi:MAG: biotin-dependent carboxyltransferase family protein [Bacteroidota bacterium]